MNYLGNFKVLQAGGIPVELSVEHLGFWVSRVDIGLGIINEQKSRENHTDCKVSWNPLSRSALKPPDSEARKRLSIFLTQHQIIARDMSVFLNRTKSALCWRADFRW